MLIDNEKYMERVKFIFIDDYFNIRFEAKTSFIDTFEEIGKTDIKKAMQFLDSHKNEWHILKEYHLKDIALDRVIHAQDDFKEYLNIQLEKIKENAN
jgi:D-mannonate dehydratase